MTKGVKICLAAVILLFVGSVIALFLMDRTEKHSDFVVIIQDNKEIYCLDLSENWEKRIEAPDGGWNDVVIKDGKISVTDADCKDKTCCNMGTLKKNSSPIVCLPHKLIIRFSEESSDDD